MACVMTSGHFIGTDKKKSVFKAREQVQKYSIKQRAVDEMVHP